MIAIAGKITIFVRFWLYGAGFRNAGSPLRCEWRRIIIGHSQPKRFGLPYGMIWFN